MKKEFVEMKKKFQDKRVKNIDEKKTLAPVNMP